jgi:DNA-binding NarL/FixJ family response regulator
MLGQGSRDAWVAGALSPQERVVLALVIEGWTSEEISVRLRCKEVTVKKHVSSLLRKFYAANRAQLAAKAVAYGLATQSESAGSAEPRRSSGDRRDRGP